MTSKKRICLYILLLIFTITFTACVAGDEGGNSEAPPEQKDANNFKVAMITDTGGIDDKSFNQSAWEGIKKFGSENNLTEGEEYKYLQSNSASDYAPNLNTLIRDNFDLVYGIGYMLQSDVQKVATQKKDAQLAIVDSVVTDEDGNLMDNVANITFNEHQGSFLVGLVAGIHTNTNKIGFVGGSEGELIKKFETGFKAGVKAVNPDAEIMVQYAEDFNAAEKGTSIANTMYSNGADIIYHSAGNTGNGVFTEAKNRKKQGQDVWVIGVDRDQHEEGMPENVTLTSMVKRVDTAIFDVTTQTMNGEFPGGQVIQFGLEDDGVMIAPTQDNVSEEALQIVEDYKQRIIDGEIVVPATDEEYDSYLESL